MPRHAAIVIAADEKYYPLLDGVLASIQAHRQSDIPVNVLDLGLSPAQRHELSSRVGVIREAQWDLDSPLRESCPRWFRAMTARPFLPKYFPDVDLILWLDCDTWLQDWRVIDLLIRAASDGRMAIVPEIHRAYAYLYNIGYVRENLFRGAAEAFDVTVAQRLATLPILNSGVFALARDAPHWAIWANHLSAAFQKSNNYFIEQTALNLAIYKDACSVHFLPAWCNWICQHAPPVYDPHRRCLCEPYLPYEKLSLIHLTGPRAATIPLTEGEPIQTGLDFHSIERLRNTAKKTVDESFNARR